MPESSEKTESELQVSIELTTLQVVVRMLKADVLFTFFTEDGDNC